jgi:hypothetical protein
MNSQWLKALFAFLAKASFAVLCFCTGCANTSPSKSKSSSQAQTAGRDPLYEAGVSSGAAADIIGVTQHPRGR